MGIATKTGTSISDLPGLYSVGDFSKGPTINFEVKISDIFRISYGFRCCHMRRYIADSTRQDNDQAQRRRLAVRWSVSLGS